MSYDFIQVRFKMGCLVSICSKRKYGQRVIPVCECLSYQNGKNGRSSGAMGSCTAEQNKLFNLKIVAKSHFL